VSRRVWPLLAAVILAASLAACGKKANLAPPENAQVPYTYPKQYPNPASVLPSPEEEAATPARPAPPHAGTLTPFPLDRTTTTTYQSAPVQ
jgi:predicted small lipoprotein YifL